MRPRKIKIVGGAAYIPLTRGYEAIVDLKDLTLVAGFNWHVVVSGRSRYAARTVYLPGGKFKKVLMHRLLCQPELGTEIDHINHNGLDNRRANMRMCKKSENMRNSRTWAKGQVPLKGVTLHSSTGKYRARITVDRRLISLGLFDTPEEAHEAYCKASKKYHGDFGYAG